jgi:hypothetical protein
MGVFAGSATMNVPSDCGYKLHRQAIEDTELLIIKREKLIIPISEMPTKNGKKECVRLGFNISNSGLAKNIIVLEDSRSFDMNVSAVDALKRYKFRYSRGSEKLRFTLVFRAVIGRAPPYPSPSAPTDH